MQNTIMPVAPTPPVESRPSPKSAPSHAFATLLKQSQTQAPTPVKTAPAAPARSDSVVDGDASAGTTRPVANAAAAAAETRRRDDAKSASQADGSGDADARTSAADDASGHGDKDKAKVDDGTAVGPNGTVLPLMHGLVAWRRPPVEAPGGDAARNDRTTSLRTGNADDAGANAASASTSASSGALAARGTTDLARRDEPSSSRIADAGATAAKAGETPALVEIAKATPFATGELRAEPTAPAAIAPTPEASATNPTAPADAAVATPLASPEFAQAFAVQVNVLVQDGVQRAELHLNPAEMGPVSVQITVDGTQARIDFGADALATRQAIEAGLPELASALRDAGMTLQGGGVSQHARDPHQGSGSGDPSTTARGSWRDDDATRPAPVVRQRTVAAGGVDLYA